mmetsp:Transcript_20945/g.53284  ORF Transcript_20945/g.53284 Transcript_20945/m.53284 type:complete len:187 (+) Transcript_20945:1415-1975(+)
MFAFGRMQSPMPRPVIQNATLLGLDFLARTAKGCSSFEVPVHFSQECASSPVLRWQLVLDHCFPVIYPLHVTFFLKQLCAFCEALAKDLKPIWTKQVVCLKERLCSIVHGQKKARPRLPQWSDLHFGASPAETRRLQMKGANPRLPGASDRIESSKPFFRQMIMCLLACWLFYVACQIVAGVSEIT